MSSLVAYFLTYFALAAPLVIAMPISRMRGPRLLGSMRLSRVPASPFAPTGRPGHYALGLRSRRDTLIHVPKSYRSLDPSPLVVAFHGPGGSAHGSMLMFQAIADMSGILLLAPASTGTTWDVILGPPDQDINLLDRALSEVTANFAVDPHRIAICGFSDGASYALSLGLANGDIFSHIIGFSPGFAAASQPVGKPAVFLSHGVRDQSAPIEQTSRKIAPALRLQGYDVRYEEFEGGHQVPPSIAKEAFGWFESAGVPLSSRFLYRAGG